MEQLKEQYGEKFSQVFRSITTDNGSEFAAFSAFENLGTKIYFAHPYSAWERPVNERTNRILRRFLPKGRSIRDYSDEQILQFADEINATPRKRLGYRTPEELFELQLDSTTPPADSAPYSVQVFNLLLHFSLQFVSTGINDMLPA